MLKDVEGEMRTPNPHVETHEVKSKVVRRENPVELMYSTRDMDVNKGKIVYIMNKDLTKYGYTVGCRGCRSRAEKWKNTANHSESCRK